MKRGSDQVEMSDEGLMTADIEDCLSVVLKAPKQSDLLAAEVIAWCSAMLENDRVGLSPGRSWNLRAHVLSGPRPESPRLASNQ